MLVKAIYNLLHDKKFFHYYAEDESILFFLTQPTALAIAINEFPIGHLLVCISYANPAAAEPFNQQLISFSEQNNISINTITTAHTSSTYDRKLPGKQQNAFKFNFALTDVELINNFLAFLSTPFETEATAIYDLKTAFMAALENNAIPAEFLANKEEFSIAPAQAYETIIVPNLADLDYIQVAIEEKKQEALKQNQTSLTVKIIATNPASNTDTPANIYFGLGFPNEGTEAQPIPLKNLEELVKTLRNLPSFHYIGEQILCANGAVFHYTLTQEIPAETVNKQAATSETFTTLDEPIENYIEVRYINDKVGFGVFARKNIPAGTKLGIYAGLLGTADTCTGYALIDDDFPTLIDAALIDAAYLGNWAHLANHANSKAEPDIHTANIEEKWIKQNNQYATPVLITSALIKEGEQLFFDYGPAYWEWCSRASYFCQFKKDNTIVDAKGEALEHEISAELLELISHLLNTDFTTQKESTPLPADSAAQLSQFSFRSSPASSSKSSDASFCPKSYQH